ncbi:MAG: hypothetical protein NTZ05_13020 [Chloroflexi bacterium]|nr:hypothetical protein [Chloroflexota bacterium]
MTELEHPGERPIPDLTPRTINIQQYYAWTPEKLELLDGYLIHGPDWSEGRRDLLMLLLVNEGLVEAVRLAPPELWRAALRQVYGEP